MWTFLTSGFHEQPQKLEFKVVQHYKQQMSLNFWQKSAIHMAQILAAMLTQYNFQYSSAKLV